MFFLELLVAFADTGIRCCLTKHVTPAQIHATNHVTEDSLKLSTESAMHDRWLHDEQNQIDGLICIGKCSVSPLSRLQLRDNTQILKALES
jgi:hypothetical protein